MIRPILCFSLVFATAVSVRGQDDVRSTQEELRRRNIYFGDIDGRQSGEFREALIRYQKKKGLTPSGQGDHDTLRSLGLLERSPGEPPPKELAWPEEPVLKSDVKISAPAVARDLAAETGVAPGSLAPDMVISPREPGRPGWDHRSLTRLRAGSGIETAEMTASTHVKPPAGRVIPEKVRRLVDDYIKAAGRNSLQDELHFYADRVDYFNNGQVDRRIIERSLRNYYQRWPHRSYSVTQPVAYSFDARHGTISLTYRVAFSLEGGGKRVKGATDNRLIINAGTSDPRIISIQEHRVRS